MIEVKDFKRYRSVPQVNMSNDSCKVILTCANWEYNRLLKVIEAINKGWSIDIDKGYCDLCFLSTNKNYCANCGRKLK